MSFSHTCQRKLGKNKMGRSSKVAQRVLLQPPSRVSTQLHLFSNNIAFVIIFNMLILYKKVQKWMKSGYRLMQPVATCFDHLSNPRPTYVTTSNSDVF